MTTTKILFARALGTAALTSRADNVKLESLPAPVRETIVANARGATVSEIDVLKVDGRTLYVAEVYLTPQKDLDLHVDADGKLIKSKEDIDLSEAPAAVQEAAGELGGTIDDIDKVVAGGKTTYHVDIERTNAPDLDVVVAEDGSIVSQREDK